MVSKSKLFSPSHNQNFFSEVCEDLCLIKTFKDLLCAALAPQHAVQSLHLPEEATDDSGLTDLEAKPLLTVDYNVG